MIKKLLKGIFLFAMMIGVTVNAESPKMSEPCLELQQRLLQKFIIQNELEKKTPQWMIKFMVESLTNKKFIGEDFCAAYKKANKALKFDVSPKKLEERIDEVMLMKAPLAECEKMGPVSVKNFKEHFLFNTLEDEDKILLAKILIPVIDDMLYDSC